MVEIISVGTELLLGDIVNTNARWIAQKLSSLGLNHYRQITIGDNTHRISELVREASLRSNLLITTGGLGPTSDDVTTEAISNAFNASLFERKYIWDEIKEKLSYKDNYKKSHNLKKQCLFPKDAEIINNPRGTAPGMIWKPLNDFTIMTFPGVPSELEEMWNESAYEYIKNNFSNGSILFSNTLKLTGISESEVSSKINYLVNSNNPTIAPYASLSEVKLRITAKAKNELEAKKLIKPLKDNLKKNFSKFIFGEDNDNLPSIVLKDLIQRNQSIVFAESCTGGLLSSALTQIPGSSKAFKGSIIAYSNALKVSLLNVPNILIEKYGAVSEQVAEAMAIGAKNNLKADWSISISGVAGPEGGSIDKPVGLVYIAITNPNNQTIKIKKQFKFIRNRNEIQRLSVNECLNRLRLILLSYKD